MSIKENKEIMRRFLEASVASDQTAYKELMAPDFVAHLADGPANRETFLQHNNLFGMAFSDKHFTILDLIAEGDKVSVRAVWRGTHSGDFRGLPPTGKEIKITAFIVDRIRDGKIVEHWSLFDQMGMMQQLGLVPSPKKG